MKGWDTARSHLFVWRIEEEVSPSWDLHKAIGDEEIVLLLWPKGYLVTRPWSDIEFWGAVMALSRIRRQSGSKVGMQAAMMPMLTSALCSRCQGRRRRRRMMVKGISRYLPSPHEIIHADPWRVWVLLWGGEKSWRTVYNVQVWSAWTDCQFKTVRTMQHAAVLCISPCQKLWDEARYIWTVGSHNSPRPMRPHRRIFCRALIWTCRKMMIGNPARMKSEMIDMTWVNQQSKIKPLQEDVLAWVMMILWTWPCVKHFAVIYFLAYHAPSTRMHCKIQSSDIIRFDTNKNIIRLCIGLIIRLLGEIRSSSRQIDTLVIIKV